MSLYWQCNSSAICSLLALDEALQHTTSIQWANRPQVLTTLDELRTASQNETGKTTQQKIENVERLTTLLLELSDQNKLPQKIDVIIAGHSISLRLVDNRYKAEREDGRQLTMAVSSREEQNRVNKIANEAMNELSAKYRDALQDAKVEISRQEQILEGYADTLSAEELEAKRAQLNAHRQAVVKANNEELKKQEEQLREVAKEMNLEVLNPVRLSRKKKFVFIRRS